MNLGEFIEDAATARGIVATLSLFVVVFALRYLALRLGKRVWADSDHQQLRWVVQVRSLAYVLLLVGLLALWATELRTLALSLAALTVAIVLATKELITCVQGAIYRMSSDAFSVGDRIVVQDVHGDVIDHGLLSTTLLEVGPGHQRTGRVISVPNSAFLVAPVLNDSLAGQYVLHVIRIPLSRAADVAAVADAALRAANLACAAFLPDVQRHVEKRYRQHSLKPPVAEPRITFELMNAEEVHLLLRLPTPTRLVRDIEQKVVRAVLGIAEAENRDSRTFV